MQANYQLQPCHGCKNGHTKRVIGVPGPERTTLVGRCMVCDTLPCPNKKCGGRNIDPTAKACKHCGTSLDLMDRK